MSFPQVFSHYSFASRVLLLAICVGVSSFTISAQSRSLGQKDLSKAAVAADSQSVVVSPAHLTVYEHANITCANLNASTDPNYAYITDNNELKLNFGSPNGTFEFRNYGNIILTGSQPAPTKSLTVTSDAHSLLSFSSQVQILAVNVKVGNTSYIYSYAYAGAPGINVDTLVPTGDPQGISHISFCYGVSLSPSAAPSTITGRVVNANGAGISGANVTVLDPSSGSYMTVRSNGFGYYMFDALPSGLFYTLSVSDKRYTFTEPTRGIELNENISDADFVADAQ